MEKERQPESGELVWDLRVEKRQQTAHIIHAGNLDETRTKKKHPAEKKELISKSNHTLRAE